MSKFAGIFLLLALTAAVGAPAQGSPAPGLPVVDFAESTEYRAQGPVWSILRAPDGTIAFGTDRLVLLDGIRSETLAVPGGYGLRGLATDAAGRLWVGGLGALGYFTQGADGGWQWSAANFPLNAGEEVWSVQAVAGGMAAVTGQRVLRWNQHPAPGQSEWQAWSLPAKPRLVAANLGGEIWIYQYGRGLLRLGADEPELVVGDAELPETPVVWMLAPPQAKTPLERLSTDRESKAKNDNPPDSEKTSPDSSLRAGLANEAKSTSLNPSLLPDGMLIGTGNGVYQRVEGTWRKLEQVSARISGQLPVCATWLDGPQGRTWLALGTFTGGVVVADLNDTVIANIDRDRGLPDNQVHALWSDGRGILWIGLSEGYARVSGLGAVSHIELNRQAVQALVPSPEGLTVVTAEAAFRVPAREQADRSGATLTPLPPVNAALRDATLADGHLWLGGFGGLWRLDGGNWVQERLVSADVLRVAGSTKQEGMLYFTEDTRLMALEFVPDRGWVPRHLAEIGDTPSSLLETDDGSIWVGTVQDGVAQFRNEAPPGASPRYRVVRYFRTGRALPKDARRCRLTRLGDTLYVFTDTGIFGLSRPGHRFEPVLAGFTGLAAAVLPGGDEAIWLAEPRSDGGPVALRVSRNPAGELAVQPLEIAGLDRIGRLRTMAVEGGTDDANPVVWIAGARGLLRVEPTLLSPALPPPAVTLRTVSTEQGKRLPRSGTAPETSVTGGHLRLGFSAATATENLTYQTRLTPNESEWTAPQAGGEREFTGLAHGRYRFEVRATDRMGRTGPVTGYAFLVPTPWYLHPGMIGAYALAGALGIAGVVRWRLRQLRRQNEKLNALVDERTRELSQANANKTEFLENLSHEIRNPLNGLVGLVGMLPETSLDARGRELSHSLTACARNLTRVFDEVLNFSKIEYGHVGLRVAAFSPAALVDEVVAVYRAQAEQRGSALQVQWTGSPPPALLGDGEKIKTILSNYVNNALKYAPGQPVEIEVEIAEPDDQHVELSLAVTDHGPGVSADEQELIFRKFARGSKAREERTPGTGLGLATCRAYAKLMGGFVGIESAPGSGSTFYLNLKLLRTDERPEPDPLPATGPGGHGHALVVEDHEYNQLVAQRIAERLGYAADVTADAATAVQRCTERAYAVIFLDWELPGAKGDEIARRLRRLPHGEKFIIIATTAHDSDDIRAKCRAAGMDGFALKPYNETTMRALIDAAQAQRPSDPKAPDGHGIIDPKVFQLVGYDDALKSAEAARLYAQGLDQCLAEIDVSLAGGDLAAAAGAAHRLRTHAGLVKHEALRAAAQALQVEATVASPEARDRLRAAVHEAAAEVRQAVKAWLAAGATRPPPG